MMRVSTLLAFVPAVLGQISTPITAGGIPTTATTTTNGPVIGRYDREDNVNRFYGVPTGATTAGANRFRPPQPVTPWTTPLETITTSPCLQPGMVYDGSFQVVGSEDCLNLDIVAPASGLAGFPTAFTGSPLPVMFWIPGGGFSFESWPLYQYKTNHYSGDDDQYSGGKVVTVFSQYRLNALGGMSHAALRLGGNQYSGNYMIYDMLWNLKWVQENIANFGGDPSKVTILGESAGATSVGVLVASPLSYSGEYAPNGPLFRSAIAESQWAVAGNGVMFSPTMRDETGDALVKALASMGFFTIPSSCAANTNTCPPATLATIAAVLRSDALAGLYVMGAQVNSTLFNEQYGLGAYDIVYNLQAIQYYPIIDGYVLPDTPEGLYRAGYGSSVNYMIGHNANEMSIYFGPSSGFALTANDDPSGPGFGYAANFGYYFAIYSPDLSYMASTTQFMTKYFSIMMAAPGTKLEAIYGGITDGYQRQEQGLTDGFFTVNEKILFDVLSAQPNRTTAGLYRFLFGQQNPVGLAAPLDGVGVPHTAELNAVWGYGVMGSNYLIDNLFLYPSQGQAKFTYPADQLEMAQTLKSYWANFVVSGNPSMAGDGLPTWSGITATDKHTMVFQAHFPQGAKLDPCIMFTSCLPEPTADFRSPLKDVWTSGLTVAPTPLPSCTGVESLLSHNAPYDYTAGCNAALSCSGWCNFWTCGLPMCAGCSASICPAAYCASWCNSFTSGLGACSGC